MIFGMGLNTIWLLLTYTCSETLTNKWSSFQWKSWKDLWVKLTQNRTAGSWLQSSGILGCLKLQTWSILKFQLTSLSDNHCMDFISGSDSKKKHKITKHETWGSFMERNHHWTGPLSHDVFFFFSKHSAQRQIHWRVGTSSLHWRWWRHWSHFLLCTWTSFRWTKHLKQGIRTSVNFSKSEINIDQVFISHSPW